MAIRPIESLPGCSRRARPPATRPRMIQPIERRSWGVSFQRRVTVRRLAGRRSAMELPITVAQACSMTSETHLPCQRESSGRVAPSDLLLDQHGHAVGAGHDVVVVAGRLADHVGRRRCPRSSGTSRPRMPWRMRNQTPRSRPSVAGMSTGIAPGAAPAALLRRSPARSSRCGAGTGSAPGRCPSGRSGAGRRARPAAAAGGRGTGSAPRCSPPRSWRGDARARAARSAPWAARSMPGQSRHIVDVAGGQSSVVRTRQWLRHAPGGWRSWVLTFPLATDQDHWPLSETDLPPDVADVVLVGCVAVDPDQRQRGGAAEGEPAVAGVDRRA